MKLYAVHFLYKEEFEYTTKKSISNAVPQEGCIVALMVILINKENNYALFFKFKILLQSKTTTWSISTQHTLLKMRKNERIN